MRVDNPRNDAMSKREDMLLDLADVLTSIKTASGYRTNPKKVDPWRVDPFGDEELPAIAVFDQESEEEDSNDNITHKLLITIEYVTSDKNVTSINLRAGAADILKAIGSIEQKLCKKYSMNQMKFTGTLMGLESLKKVNGCIDVIIEAKYKTPRWQL